MALGPRLELRQRQALVMTPQLQQAIKLLQMSNLELTEYVETELERNPLLERDESGEGSDGPAADAPEDTGPAEETSGFEEAPDPADSVDLSTAEAMPAEDSPPLDTDYADVYTTDSGYDAQGYGGEDGLGATDWQSGRGAAPTGEGSVLEQTLSADTDLRTHMAAQIATSFHDATDRLIAGYLAEQLDEAGYLTVSAEQAAENLGADLGDVEAVLAHLQSMDPTGVFARDLAECLALQLAERDRLDPCMQTFLANLDMVAAHDLAGLAKICGVDRDDVLDMLAEIRELSPKPGMTFGGSALQPVIPDVFVRKMPDGIWQVDLNADTLPKVLINNRYRARVAGGDQAAKEFLTDALNSANWLVRALEQRANTILKVSAEIVRQQEGFLNHGVGYLRPLTLRDVATAIDMHESTVSRVTSNKYMATSRGIFELKYFFTAALASSSGGQTHSAEAVRHRIRQLIEAEEVGDILSDDKIVEILNKAGIDVARRTVAKYREGMGIPSSVKRRRLKKMEAAR